MRLRRRFPVLFGLLLLIAAVTIAVQLRKHAPPEPARLLPSADAFLYMNLKWMRVAEMANKLPPVPHDPDYEQFVRATGFQFERDLKQVAFAMHYPSPETGGERRFSEIFIAHFDGDKLRAYLKTLARSTENYRAVDIFNIPVQDRTVRVAILGVDTVAASNHNDAGVIRGIIDRSRKLASPFGGPALLRQFYKYVPQLPLPSLGWAIFKVDPSAHSVKIGDAHADQIVRSAAGLFTPGAGDADGDGVPQPDGAPVGGRAAEQAIHAAPSSRSRAWASRSRSRISRSISATGRAASDSKKKRAKGMA